MRTKVKTYDLNDDLVLTRRDEQFRVVFKTEFVDGHPSKGKFFTGIPEVSVYRPEEMIDGSVRRPYMNLSTGALDVSDAEAFEFVMRKAKARLKIEQRHYEEVTA